MTLLIQSFGPNGHGEESENSSPVSDKAVSLSYPDFAVRTPPTAPPLVTCRQDVRHCEEKLLLPMLTSCTTVDEEIDEDVEELEDSPKGNSSLGLTATPRGQNVMDRWEQKTRDQISHSKALVRQASALLGSGSARGLQKRRPDPGKVKHLIQKHFGTSTNLIKALGKAVDSTESAIREAGECLFESQRVYRQENGPVCVCEERLKLRETAPPQEKEFDLCRQALETQRTILLSERKELSTSMQRLKEMLLSLESMKNELYEDLARRRHDLKLEHSILFGGSKSASNTPRLGLSASSSTADRLLLPSLNPQGSDENPVNFRPEATLSMALEEPQRCWGIREVDEDSESVSSFWPKKFSDGGHDEERGQSITLLTKAASMQKDAHSLCSSVLEASKTARARAARALHEVHQELNKRSYQTQKVRTELEEQLIEVNETIRVVKANLVKSQKGYKIQQEKLRLALSGLAASTPRRNVKPTEESTAEEFLLHEKEERLKLLKSQCQEHASSIESLSTLLEQLTASKEQLQEEQRRKIQMQKIDAACLKVASKKSCAVR